MKRYIPAHGEKTPAQIREGAKCECLLDQSDLFVDWGVTKIPGWARYTVFWYSNAFSGSVNIQDADVLPTTLSPLSHATEPLPSDTTDDLRDSDESAELASLRNKVHRLELLIDVLLESRQKA